ncbi:bifunctional metallophosphatase/5'-nucleotidase [Paenibacillus physcomitrellae]|uniref:Metallophosphoesterase YunD n=1 Tax=Paenibacillus physcomitrellae TaxID=1619311 RepID=A0ABQ1GXT8_9BACL|nr:bifunctional UDP-sugar hydrolase/5'-nucleotidase [Paenibacillus physcomitrellae]GGA52579.1 putative metallophosphoesterase YunD [Paenibacillus physcomitrellae]
MRQHTEPEQLMILHTNDIHSHFGAMVQLSEMIESERQIWRDDLLLLDIGDHMDRAAVETEGTLGQANVDVLNLTGYDAVTIGNNEGLTFTPDMLEQAYAGLQCPVVCCNIRETSTGTAPHWMKEHHIVQKGGFNIGLIGATAAFSEFYRILGWDALEPVEAIREQVEQLRDQVDFIILMSHLGLRMDEQLAEEIQGIDLILGGHSHHLLEQPLYIKNTCLAAAEKYGHYLGRILVKRSPEGRAAVQEGGVLKVDPLAESRGDRAEPLNKVAEAIAIHAGHAAEQLKRTVAITERVVPVQYDRESPFANLLAQSVRRFTGSQISIVNSGQLLDALPAGEITEGMLHALCPSPINPCRMKLRGEHILQSLEESLVPETAARQIHGFGFRGKVLGSLCVDGLEVEYDPSGAPFSRISKATIEGVPIVPEIEYDVGTLDMFTFGIGYKALSLGTDKVFILPEFIRDLLRLELQTPGAVEQSFSSRWHISS